MERAEAEAIYDSGREAVVAVLLRMDEQIQQLSRQVTKQGEEIAELKRRLNRSSRNSSTPPSQDPPGAPERKRPDPSGRSQGAQLGHRGKGRKLLPVEAVDRVVDHWPARCGCGRCFADADEEAGEPARHQVTELPEIAVAVIEHRLHRRLCPDCGKATRAVLPAGVPAGSFGPRLEAAVATLAVRNRISRRDTVELAGELFGAGLASGTVDAILARTGQALAEPYEDLLGAIREAAALNVDETGWKLRGEKRTLWGAVTPGAAVFRIPPDRHEREVAALLGEDFGGIVGSDRWWAYRGFDPNRRQACWSHLIRDLTAHSEGLGAQKRFGEAGLDIARRLFEAWDGFQEHGDRRRLKREVAPLKRELKALLKRGSKGRPTSSPGASPRTCSRSGRRYGPSSRSRASSRPTTEPSAPCAARSSTASSRSAASPSAARPPPSGCSRPRSPAGCRDVRCSTTWQTCSARGFVAILLRC